MTSWRDATSDEAQRDLDALLGGALGFAQRQLGTRGEFFPYAAAIRADRQVEMIAPDVIDSGSYGPADLVAACFTSLIDKRDQIRAAAVVSDVRTGDDEEAIRVDLEHSEGQALAILLPYTKKRLGEIDYGQIRAQAGQLQIWI